MIFSPGQVLGEVLQAFRAGGADVQVVPLGAGNINDTYLVQTAGQKFVLQRINSAVFPEPERVVANFARVSSHIAEVAGSQSEPFL